MKPWQITYAEHVITDLDFGAQELYDLELLGSVEMFEPVTAAGQLNLRSWMVRSWLIALIVAGREGGDAREVHSTLMELSINDVPIPEPRELPDGYPAGPLGPTVSVQHGVSIDALSTYAGSVSV